MEDQEIQGVEAPNVEEATTEESLLNIEPQEGEGEVTDENKPQEEQTSLSYEEYQDLGISEEEFAGIQEKYGKAGSVQEALKMFFDDMKNAPKEEEKPQEYSVEKELAKVPEDLQAKIPQIKAWAMGLEPSERKLMAQLSKTAEGLAQVEEYRQAKLQSIPKGGGNSNNRVPSGAKPLGKDWLMSQQKNELFYSETKEGEAFRTKLNQQIAENGDGSYFPEGYRIKL